MAAYIGDLAFVFKVNITRGAAPSTLIIFDKDGRYLKTIYTGEEPLGYFNIPVE